MAPEIPDPTDLRPMQLMVARASRRGGADSDATFRLRRELKEAKLTRYIEKIVAEAPPFTDEQVDRLSALLRPAE